MEINHRIEMLNFFDRLMQYNHALIQVKDIKRWFGVTLVGMETWKTLFEEWEFVYKEDSKQLKFTVDSILVGQFGVHYLFIVGTELHIERTGPWFRFDNLAVYSDEEWGIKK